MRYIFLIIFIALFTRLFWINKIPPHLSNDEISIAYDAYSIANSGKDEHGKSWPLLFESHGTYKGPVYAYLLAPLVKIFGNSEVTVRIPSLLSGFLTIWLIGLITFELTKNIKTAYWAAGILAASPYHIIVSRMALETNVALFFLSLGIYLLLQNKKLGGVVALVLSMYTYYTEWVLVPLIFCLFIKKLKFKYSLLGAILSLPLLSDYFISASSGIRANSELLWREAGFQPTIINIIYRFGQNYLSYFNPAYLFFNGNNLLPTGNPWQTGLFLWPMMVPFFIGLTKLNGISKKYWWFFGGWLLISPVTASLTHGGPNMMRNLNTIIPLVIIMSLGAEKMKKWWWGLMGVALIYFGLLYLVNYPIVRADSFQGYKQVAQYIKTIEDTTDSIYIDYRFGDYRTGRGPEYFGVPHLYFGFFNSWDPKIIQNREEVDDGNKFGKYWIGQIDWNKDIYLKDRLYIVSMGNTPTPGAREKLSLEKVFDNFGGVRAFEVWRGK